MKDEMNWTTPCLMPYVNNQGADQPAHLRSLISAFVVRCLDTIKPTLTKSKISRLQLVSVAAQAGLSHTWLQTPKDRFPRDVAQLTCHNFVPPIPRGYLILLQ